ncbi:MAG: patatin-like phospholipase family protein [Magnetococcus sp. YQC-5]
MSEKDLSQTILQEEFDEIAKRRQGVGPHKNKLLETMVATPSAPHIAAQGAMWPEEPGAGSIPQDRIGLAISGGGIRSATFSLGILQFLGKKNFFSQFDYLSTVSGGGFLGSCLTSWYTNFSQCQQDSTATPDFPFVHNADEEESVPFQHLRNFSNYLAPKGDLADEMRMVALFIRGVIINFFLILPYLLIAAAVTIPLMPILNTELHHLTGSKWLAGTSFSVAILIFLSTTIIFSNSDQKFKWKTRNQVTRLMGWVVVMVGGCFFLALQPMMLKYFHQLHTLHGNQSGTIIGSLGGLSSIYYFFINKMKRGQTETSTPWGKYIALTMAFLLVPLFLWGLFLYLLELGLVWNAGSNIVAKTSPDGHWIVGYALFGMFFYWLGTYFNINKYSLHVFYRDRLSRAYLIGPHSVENWKRERPCFNDALKLSELDFSHAPYHLVNAALNITTTDDEPDSKDDFVNRGRTADFFFVQQALGWI